MNTTYETWAHAARIIDKIYTQDCRSLLGDSARSTISNAFLKELVLHRTLDLFPEEVSSAISTFIHKKETSHESAVAGALRGILFREITDVAVTLHTKWGHAARTKETHFARDIHHLIIPRKSEDIHQHVTSQEERDRLQKGEHDISFMVRLFRIYAAQKTIHAMKLFKICDISTCSNKAKEKALIQFEFPLINAKI